MPDEAISRITHGDRVRSLLPGFQPPLKRPHDGLLAHEGVREKLDAALTRASDLLAARERRNDTQALVENARAKDARAGADALKAGKPDPGRVYAKKAEAFVLDAEHAVALTAQLEADARRDLVATLKAERAALLAALAERNRAELAKAYELMGEANRCLGWAGRARATQKWVADPTTYHEVPDQAVHALASAQRALSEMLARVAA